MEFFDKLTKKASETYKGAAEKTSKLAKEAKLKLKINENKSKINDLYQEIGKKVYQKHTETGDVCIKKDLYFLQRCEIYFYICRITQIKFNTYEAKINKSTH